jgi:hypothetical protein
MSNNEKLSFWYSWPSIIFFFIIFWPIGLVLLIKRFSTDKKAVVSAASGKKSGTGLGWGIGLTVFGIIGFISCVSDSDGSGAVGLCVFITLGGIVLILNALRIKKEAEDIKQYLAVIVNGNVRQLDYIASSTGKSYERVHKDIRKMIKNGYLKNAYINEETREVVLPITNAQQGFSSAAGTPVSSGTGMNTAGQARIVVCPCCGANNTVYGDIGECEYCGSALK